MFRSPPAPLPFGAQPSLDVWAWQGCRSQMGIWGDRTPRGVSHEIHVPSVPNFPMGYYMMQIANIQSAPAHADLYIEHSSLQTHGMEVNLSACHRTPINTPRVQRNVTLSTYNATYLQVNKRC
jgi:hypothetical protein